MFWESVQSDKINLFLSKSENFSEEKIFFHPRVHPVYFELFGAICTAHFGLRYGKNWKLETSSFHTTSSFCDQITHVSAVKDPRNINFITPSPYSRVYSKYILYLAH